MERPGSISSASGSWLPDGRQAVWDSDGTAGLEAQVMRDGMLVGFVPSIDGSADFDVAQTVDAIHAHRLRPAGRPAARHAAAPAEAAAPAGRGVPPLPRRLPGGLTVRARAPR